MTWGSPEEIERRRRIRVSLWAYAYEIRDTPFVSDSRFDDQCRLIDLSVDTGNREMDVFFRTHFTPDTGMWIHKHPDLTGLATLYERVRSGRITDIRELVG